MKPSILIVDDDKHTRDGLQRALRAQYDIRLAENGETALRLLKESPPDLMLTDLRMPGMDGLNLLRRARASHPGLLIILLTAYGSVETAVEAMKHGATDFLTKPVNLDQLELLLQRTLRNRARDNADCADSGALGEHALPIIGASPAMQRVLAIVKQAAPTQATILINGESGTGKELVARAIHNLSPRAKNPFIPVHCAALTPTLFESELFGHEKGAFTGAEIRRKGRFELAHNGTLFLDEISELDPALQVKLLRVLQERRFERVGGEASIDVDFRLVSATNRDLSEWVRQGKFREDLYFRLNVIDITLPPLRERHGDIPLLCGHFLAEFAKLHNRPVRAIAPETMLLLQAYPWPGNIRELQRAIEKMVILAPGDTLAPEDLPPNIAKRENGHSCPFMPDSQTDRNVRSPLMPDERAQILAALAQCRNNRTRAAQLLGIPRRTFQRKLAEYGIPLKISKPANPNQGTAHAAPTV